MLKKAEKSFEGVPMSARSSIRSTVRKLPVIHTSVVLGVGVLLLIGVLAWKHMQNVTVERLAVEAAAREERRIADQKIFLEEAIPLYASAITGTQRVVELSQNVQLRDFAEQSVETQTGELWFMLGWYQSKYKEPMNSLSHTKSGVVEVSQLRGDDLDRTYLQAMIDRNNALLSLARNVSISTSGDEFQSFISNLITSKKKENEDLSKLLEPYLRK